MKVTGIKNNSLSFNKLYYTQPLKEMLSTSDTSPNFIKKTEKIKNILSSIKADRKKYVDVILDYEDCNFYGVISSKKQVSRITQAIFVKFQRNAVI